MKNKCEDLIAAKEWYRIAKEQDNKLAIEILENKFPELIESEDERIIREITEFLVDFNNGEYERPSENTIDSWLAWLEKQGEQNLVRHFCDCVHVGCHVNDCKRWCHSYQKEISYTDCNSNCNRYSKLVNHAFNIGEIITDGISTFKIAGIKDNYYIADDGEKVEIYMAHRYYIIIQNMEVQKPVEWTAKDEKTIVKIRDFFIRVFGDKPDFTEDKRYEEFIEFIDNRLKSLRPQSQWKPSDEQMEALSNAGNSFRPFEEGHKVLWSLYNDLKKLREE